jgi:hypothetical protein
MLFMQIPITEEYGSQNAFYDEGHLQLRCFIQRMQMNYRVAR